jgi:hypothetical protein
VEGTSQFGKPARDPLTGMEVKACYAPLVPAWPSDPDPEVTESPEAKAWLGELEGENAERRAMAEQEASETLAERLAPIMRRAEQRYPAESQSKAPAEQRCDCPGGFPLRSMHLPWCPCFTHGQTSLPCKRCDGPVKPGDIAYNHSIDGKAVCNSCLGMRSR